MRLLSEAGCDRIFDEQIHGTDLVLGAEYRFGMGYGLSSGMMPHRAPGLLLGRLRRVAHRDGPGSAA